MLLVEQMRVGSALPQPPQLEASVRESISQPSVRLSLLQSELPATQKPPSHELAEQMDWRYPDWIFYPTGGGTGMVGMWKAFDEMESIGWIAPGRRPRESRP